VVFDVRFDEVLPDDFPMTSFTKFTSEGVLDTGTKEKLIATAKGEKCLSPGYDYRQNGVVLEPCGNWYQGFSYDPVKETLQTFAYLWDGTEDRTPICLLPHTDTMSLSYVICDCEGRFGFSNVNCRNVLAAHAFWVSDNQGHIMYDDPYGNKEEYCLCLKDDGMGLELGPCDSAKAVTFASTLDLPVPSQSPTSAPTTLVPSQTPTSSAPTKTPTTQTPTLHPSTLEPSTHVLTEHPAIVNDPDVSQGQVNTNL
jgi:hypothetical protein